MFSIICNKERGKRDKPKTKWQTFYGLEKKLYLTFNSELLYSVKYPGVKDFCITVFRTFNIFITTVKPSKIVCNSSFYCNLCKRDKTTSILQVNS